MSSPPGNTVAVDRDTLQRLIDELVKDRAVLQEAANKTHALLQTCISSTRAPQLDSLPRLRRRSNASGMPLTRAALRDTTANLEVESLLRSPNSAFSADSDSESDANESIYVQTPLQPEVYDMEGFRQHLRHHKWTERSQEIINFLHQDDLHLAQFCLLPLTAHDALKDRSYLTHYSIYDVGPDGAPLDIRSAGPRDPTRAMEIWSRISSTNSDPDRSRPTVGRIIIVREPSPALFAGLHYVLNKHIDMDELFDLLHNDDPGLSYPHRAFADNPRHSRTFVISFEYFTVIGDHCIPSPWQRFDKGDGSDDNHIPISRCSSCVVLALEASEPMTKVRNRDRRIDKKFGDVFDPFAPYRVVALMSYPDWHSTTDTHKPTNHYINGPEAFLVTVEAEFNDARKRLKEVYHCVSELVEPPANFIFDEDIRESMLFEDPTFTYSKRYFWAYQTLSIVNQDITEMIESYRETFKDSVWEGSNKIIWPGESSTSSRYQQWRKRMAKIRREIEFEVHRLEEIRALNEKKMKDIEALRENLFCGTSVRESRSSVEQTKITIEQNRSLMLLTLVTLVFLPLTFVTGVYGMTNMNPNDGFASFGITTVCICVPTYLFVGSLYSDQGRRWWTRRLDSVYGRLFGSWPLARLGLQSQAGTSTAAPTLAPMTLSVTQADKMREAQVADALSLMQTLSQTSSSHNTTFMAMARPNATSGDAALSAAGQTHSSRSKAPFSSEFSGHKEALDATSEEGHKLGHNKSTSSLRGARRRAGMFTRVFSRRGRDSLGPRRPGDV